VVNRKPCVDPSGFVCLVTRILPSCRLLKVQVTVSPGLTETVSGGSPLLQVALVRSHPAGVFSEMAYVPGERNGEAFDCPSPRTKLP
jgi:hypothetical protein